MGVPEKGPKFKITILRQMENTTLEIKLILPHVILRGGGLLGDFVGHRFLGPGPKRTDCNTVTVKRVLWK